MQFFQPLADKVKSKLASWKGKCLSMIGHVQIVNSVIFDIMSYNLHIYKWPINLLKEVNKWVRNFIWTNDVLKTGLVTIS